VIRGLQMRDVDERSAADFCQASPAQRALPPVAAGPTLQTQEDDQDVIAMVSAQASTRLAMQRDTGLLISTLDVPR